jgi:GH43 family beta-xylosidase
MRNAAAFRSAAAFMIACVIASPVAAQATFRNPINSGPDPFLAHWQGNYYLTVTGGTGIRIWKSPTLGGLKQAGGKEVWNGGPADRCCNIWAPEFHLLEGPDGPRWYLYYTADDNTDSHHRMHVLESNGADPLGPYHYKARLQTDPKNEFYAIDGTVFRKGDGSLYFVWAGYPDHRLYIMAMENPWTTKGARTLIPADGFGCPEVREGPFMLKRNGKLFLTYSACDTQKPDYMLGMVIADESSDPLKAASWIQHTKPIFTRADAAGVFGPGHHSFFKSPDGKEDWILYHGKTTSAYTYSGRTTRAQKFTWSADGIPDFGKPLSLDAEVTAPSGDGTSGVGLRMAGRTETNRGYGFFGPGSNAAPGMPMALGIDASGRLQPVSPLAVPPAWRALPKP